MTDNKPENDGKKDVEGCRQQPGPLTFNPEELARVLPVRNAGAVAVFNFDGTISLFFAKTGDPRFVDRGERRSNVVINNLNAVSVFAYSTNPDCLLLRDETGHLIEVCAPPGPV